MIYDWERFSAGVGGEPDEGEDAQEGGPLVVLLEGPQLRVQPGRSRFRTRPTQLYQNQNQKYFIDPRGDIVVPGAPYNRNINTLQTNPTSIEDKIR